MQDPRTSGDGVEHVTVVEDRGDGHWIVAFLAVFVVVGLAVALVVVMTGGPWFALVWVVVFAGPPGAWLWHTRRRLERADFVVSPYGVHGADAAEGEWLPWGDAVAFVWRPTGESINDERLWAVHLLRGDGSTVRLASLGCRRPRHETVERQLAHAKSVRLVPEHVAIVRAGHREPPAQNDASPVEDDLSGWDSSDDSDD